MMSPFYESVERLFGVSSNPANYDEENVYNPAANYNYTYDRDKNLNYNVQREGPGPVRDRDVTGRDYATTRDSNNYTGRDYTSRDYTGRDTSTYTGRGDTTTYTGPSYYSGRDYSARDYAARDTTTSSKDKEMSNVPGVRGYRCSYCHDGRGLRKWPAMDVARREADYIIRCDVPGVPRGDIKVCVTVEGQGRKVLTISGERKEEFAQDKSTLARMERAVGKFERSLMLPSDIDEKGIKAKYENGELTLTLPRSKEAQPKVEQIKIE